MNNLIAKITGTLILISASTISIAGEPSCGDGDCISVPEPSSFSLFAIAIAATVYLKLKNRNK